MGSVWPVQQKWSPVESQGVEGRPCTLVVKDTGSDIGTMWLVGT